VMLNFNRWFPQSKIIFMAPTKPLVAQQLKACCAITGIPASKVAILLDKQRKNREQIWSDKQVFFTTPQVVENDLCSGIINPKSVSLLVIDEAHRAKGNYAYNNVVKFLNRFNSSYRILALTATPASDVDGVQEVIDNLAISKVEVRTENSIDIIKYIKRKKIIRRTIGPSIYIENCIELLSEAIAPALKLANERKILEITDPLKINFFQCMEASRKITKNRSIPEGLKWSNFFILQLLGVVGQCLRRLNIYGIRSFYSYFTEKYTEFTTKYNAKKSKNKLNLDFYHHPSITKLLEETKKLLDENVQFSHPKMEALVEELEDFFTLNNNPDSKVIIFTEYRESALEIVQMIEKIAIDSEVAVMNNLKPHIFIGQAKERDKFDEVKYTQKQKKSKKSKGVEAETSSKSGSSRTSSEDAQVNGMNQKLQKQIINQFKTGAYNVLVATSIGEEGLDIGEVDLIVCFDSTSSPIKNIQRMGRTGRKRDGKVVLLFSSNEEQKFDKAMGGYEYIQLHIMKGELISLAPPNRIIPKDFEPEVVQKMIEIPEENKELKYEDNEDEIIRIATQYMLGSVKKKSKSKRQAKEKPQKKFFLPDNAQTDFRTASSLLNEDINDNNKSQTQEDKSERITQSSNYSEEKSVLDSILDSDDDDNDMNTTNLLEKSVLEENDEPKTTTPRSKTHLQLKSEVGFTESCNKSKKTLGLKRPRLNYSEMYTQNQTTQNQTVTPELKLESTSNSTPSTGSMINSSAASQASKKKTLGLKKQRITTGGITDLLKSCQQKTIKHDPNEIITIDDDDILDLPSYTPVNAEPPKENDIVKTSLDSPVEEEDIFDDGLDEELALISSVSMPSVYDQDLASSQLYKSGDCEKQPPSHIVKEEKEEILGADEEEEEVYKDTFEPTDGVLNANEKMELYTSYYTTLDPSERVSVYDPADCIQGDRTVKGNIEHSRKSYVLLNHARHSKHLTEAKAKEMLAYYTAQKEKVYPLCTVVVSDEEEEEPFSA